MSEQAQVAEAVQTGGASRAGAPASASSSGGATRVQMRSLAGRGYGAQAAALTPDASTDKPASGAGGAVQFAKKSGKERGSDIPSWAKGETLQAGETPVQGATRVCDAKYGAGNYEKGPGSEFNKIKKFFERTKDE